MLSDCTIAICVDLWVLRGCSCELLIGLLKKANLVEENTQVDDDQHLKILVFDPLHVIFEGSEQIDAFEVLSFS